MIVTISVPVSQRNGRLCKTVRVRYDPAQTETEEREHLDTTESLY